MNFQKFVELVREAKSSSDKVKVFERGGLGVTSVCNSRKTATLVNTTPHSVSVFDATDRVILQVAAAADPLRLGEEVVTVGRIAGVSVVSKVLQGIDEETLQELAANDLEEFYFVVPLVVAQAARYRRFVVPDDPVRDEKGRIVGCRRFSIVI